MEYMIQGETLTAIANAIREKTGGTNPIDPSQMATEISGMSGGGLPFGIEALAAGTYTITTESTSGIDIEHGLGVTPNFFLWTLDGEDMVVAAPYKIVSSLNICRTVSENATASNSYAVSVVYKYYNSSSNYSIGYTDVRSSNAKTYMNATTCRMRASNSSKLLAGYTYRWVAGVITGIG